MKQVKKYHFERLEIKRFIHIFGETIPLEKLEAIITEEMNKFKQFLNGIIGDKK